MDETDNARVHGDLLEAILALPASEAKAFVDLVGFECGEQRLGAFADACCCRSVVLDQPDDYIENVIGWRIIYVGGPLLGDCSKPLRVIEPFARDGDIEVVRETVD